MRKTPLKLSLNLQEARVKADMVLEVLGAPFGGHNNGRDADGQFFSPNTDFMIEVGDERPVLYYHGMTPRGTNAINPQVIGKAKLTRIDANGLWFDVILNPTIELARRVFEAAKEGLAKASSGAVNYLVRIAEKTGEILSWPLAELSLIDVGGGRQPANQLAAVQLKAMFDDAELEMPQGLLQTGEVKNEPARDDEGDKSEIPIKEKITMTDEKEKEVKNQETPASVEPKLDLNSIKADLLTQVKADLLAEVEAKKAQEERDAKIAAEAVKAAKADWEAANLKRSPAFNVFAGKYSKNQSLDELEHWARTGDDGASKVLVPGPVRQKALQEGSDTEGGYLVPDDFLSQIIAKRDQMSWVRQAGVRVLQTSRDVINIPVEDTGYSVFDVAAEEAATSASDPIFNQVAVTIYTFRKNTIVSNELLNDDATDLLGFIALKMGEAWANTEGQYVAVGTGSSQPQGAFVGGTAGLTFDSTGNITADEIPELYHKLETQYRGEAVWLMHNEVEGYLRQIRDANDFAFDFAHNVSGSGISGLQRFSTFYGGAPIFNEQASATIATAAKVMMIGNFQYYALVENSGFEIVRNPWLRMDTYQTSFYGFGRWGGAVLQAEAFQYGTMA